MGLLNSGGSWILFPLNTLAAFEGGTKPVTPTWAVEGG